MIKVEEMSLGELMEEDLCRNGPASVLRTIAENMFKVGASEPLVRAYIASILLDIADQLDGADDEDQ